MSTTHQRLYDVVAAADVDEVDDGDDGGVEQEALVGRQARVRDGPPRHARLHVLAQRPAAVRVIKPHASVGIVRIVVDTYICKFFVCEFCDWQCHRCDLHIRC